MRGSAQRARRADEVERRLATARFPFRHDRLVHELADRELRRYDEAVA